MSNLEKRKWKALYTKEGKFFTGYPFGWFSNGDDGITEGEHKSIAVKIRPGGFGRGRSSATFKFKDVSGFSYEMTCKGTSILFQMLANKEVIVEDGYFILDIIQVKQGQNYAVEPYGDY